MTRPCSAALLPSGKLLATGTAFRAGHGNDFALARYNTDGTVDTSFGAGGFALGDGGGADEARVVMVQPDGKLVAAGFAYNGANYDFALARLNPGWWPGYELWH